MKNLARKIWMKWLSILKTIGNAFRCRYYARLLGALGEGAFISPGVEFLSPEHIRIGARFLASRHCRLDASGQGSILIGNHVNLSDNVILDAGENGVIKIGDGSGFGPYCVLRSSAHNYQDPAKPFKSQGHKPGTITVEDDVWVASSVVLLPGTHLEKGCVVGSGSVVSGVVKAFSVVAGNPARVIGRRGGQANSSSC